MIENLPFSALRIFESAARHLSFKRAAEELFITPAAVSQQIKTLEHQLGVKLFNRHSRGLSLTEEAIAGLPDLKTGFDKLIESANQIRGMKEDSNLTVWMAPSFAAKWLIPRLHRFYKQYPGIDLNISVGRNLIDSRTSKRFIPAENFKRDNVDIAIRFGKGDYPGCCVIKLFSVDAIPLCSPKLLTGKHPLKSPEDLRFHTLLHDATPYEGRPDWATWLKAADVTGVDSSHGAHFNNVNLALTAAIEGQGVVLSLKALASEDIAAGRLVIPFNRSLPLEYAYYLITLEERNDDVRIGAFRDWLIHESESEVRT
jgi:LysR family transcriptional regulator, glycine cleavage system transcriptional activator